MIDSHCHLDQEPLIDNISTIIERAKANGVNKLLTICTTSNSLKKIKRIVILDDIIFGTIGIHPHETEKESFNLNYIIETIKKNKKIIGVGETGLDFYYNHSNKEKQINSFEEHIEASISANVPVIVHSRNAEVKTFEILNSFKSKSPAILMHCFTGSFDLVNKLKNLNVFYSASGIITFKNTNELQETFKKIPLNKLLIETDAPYLAPEPMRGKKNEPSFLKYTAAKLASLKNIPEKEIIKITTNNFEKLFFDKLI